MLLMSATECFTSRISAWGIGMMKKISGTLALCGTIGAMSILNQAAAQDNVEWLNSGDIVVTARRKVETVQTVPVPVTAVSGEQLESRSVLDIKQIQQVTPNLAFTRAGNNPNTAQIFLRGIGQFQSGPGQDPKVGVYVDGVYLARPQGAVFDLVDIDRVEVVRGPQGTLFGRNTTAGLVQTITNKPTQDFEGSVLAGAGNDNQFRVEGILNFPVSDVLAFRIVTQHREAGGITLNRATNKKWGNENRQTLRASALWEPSESFDALFQFQYDRSRSRPTLGKCEYTGPEDGSLTAGLPFIAYIFGVYNQIRDTCNSTEPYLSTDSDPDNNKSDAYFYSMNLNYYLGDVTFTSTTAYRDLDDLSRSSGFGQDVPGGPSYYKILQDSPSEYNQFSQELRVSGSSFNDRLDWIVGAFFFRERGFQPLDVPFFQNVGIPTLEQSPIYYELLPDGGGITFGDLAQSVKLSASESTLTTAINRSWAAFSELSYKITDDFSVTVGARYSKDWRTLRRVSTFLDGSLNPAFSCPNGIAPEGGKKCVVREAFEKLTPRAILSYTLSPDVMIYGSWSTGYSSGGFNADGNLRPYLPETSHTFEAGMKTSFLDRRAIFNLTGFHNNYRNQQSVQPRQVNNQIFYETINAQRAVLYGVEGELTLRPTDRFQIFAAFGLLKGKYKEFVVNDIVDEEVVGRDISDSRMLFGAPAYTYSISANYDFDLGNDGILTFGLGWSARGKTTYRLEAYPTSIQKAFGLMDGQIVWTSTDKDYSVSLRGSNLLGKTYFDHAFDLVDITGATARYYGAPRRVLLTVRKNF